MICLEAKWRVLIISYLGVAISSFPNDYGLIINDLKETFNFTQTQANLPGSMAVSGYQLSLPAAFLLDRFGYGWTYLVAMFLSVVPCSLTAAATYSPEFYHNYPGIIDAYLFSLGFGSATMFVSCLRVNLANFSGDHHGKIVGFFGAFFGVGPAMHTLIYQLPVYGQNKLGEYFILTGVLFFIINLNSIPLIREYLPEEGELTEVSATSYSSDANENSEERRLLEVKNQNLPVDESHNLHFWQIICSPTLLLITIVMGLGRCAILAVINIFGTIAHSLELNDFIGLVGILGPSLSATSSVVIGYLSDRFVHMIPRVFYMIAVTLILTLLSVMSIWFAKLSFVPTMIFSFIGAATFTVGLPILLKDHFGLRYLTHLFGLVELVQAVMLIILGWSFGSLYDMNIPAKTGIISNTCIGVECLQTTFVTLTLANAISCLLLVILYSKRLSKGKTFCDK